MQQRMVFIKCTVILFLICGSGAIISQNDLAFWTLLKEYHEMDLPAQAVAAGVANDSGGDGGGGAGDGASRPVAVPVARAGQTDEVDDAGPVAQPASDDVALRLLVQLTSEPVQLRVSCARGCPRVHRPCDLYLAPGSPLRMVCYAMLPECMHYGHTTINCGVYFTKRWPEVIQAVCTLDYHTSDSICASFARAGAGGGGKQTEAEKPFRLMLESLGVRLWPANASASAGLADTDTDAPAPAPAAPDDECATWLLAAFVVLLALLLAAYLVRRFDLAHWTPCHPAAAATWLDRYEVVEATRHAVGSSPISVVANVPFHSSDTGDIFSIRTGDTTFEETPTSSRNYKLFMVFIDGINNRRFSLSVPSSSVYFDADNLRMAEVPQNSSCASAPSFNHHNLPTLPAGVSANSEKLLSSKPIHATYNEYASTPARNALQFYTETSHLKDVPHGCTTTHSAISSFTESPLQETSVQLRKQSKVVISHLSSTENALAVVSLSHSTASVSKTSCSHSPNALQLETTKSDSLEVALSSHFTSKSKPSAMSSQEVESTLLTSPCPTIALHQTPKPSPAPPNAVHPQQLHASALTQPVSLAYPAAWVCPMVFPHPMSSSYPGGPTCPPNSSQLEVANSELTVPALSDGYVQPSPYPETTEYPTTIAYPNTQAYFPNGPCSETVVLPAMQTYAVTEAYPVTLGCPSSGYSTVALSYPLPVYSQAAMNPHNGLHYQYPEGIVGSANQVPSTALYSNSACPENAVYIPDFRAKTEESLSICPLQPPSTNREAQITSDCAEKRSYADSFMRQPRENMPAYCNTAGLPTYTVNPAVCYPTASTYPVTSETQDGPSVEDYTQNSLCQPASTNQTFNNQQSLINSSATTFHSPHQRTYAYQQPSTNHRILSHPHHSAPSRHPNQHSFGIQKLMDQQRSPPNYRPSTYHRPAINVRPQRPTQRAATCQQTLYRPAPMHPPPPHRTPATSQPAITLRAMTPYGSTYHPVAPVHMGSTCHTTATYHPAAAYQALPGSQPMPTNPPATRFAPLVVCQDASPHQQANVAYPNDSGYQPEPPCPPEHVNQPSATYEAGETPYNPEALQQPPPVYQTSRCPPPPNYQQPDIFQPAPVYQQPHIYQIPAFQQESVNPTAPVFQVAPGHQVHGIPDELASGFMQPLNCQVTPYPAYVPTITTCNQNYNQIIAAGETASLRPEATEQQSSFVPQPFIGYCTNSACLEMGSYHDTSGKSQRAHTELPDPQNGCYSENARECSISIGAPDICVNENNCGQPFTGDPRVMQICQMRPDYPVISSLPLNSPYPTSTENMEAASMASGHPTVCITTADWENNSAYGGAIMGQPMPYSHPPWSGPTVSAPTQSYEIIDEGAYRNEEENSRGVDLQEATPPSNLPYYECNTHPQTQAYNAPDENFQFSQQAPEQSTGSGDGHYDSTPQRNLFVGADGCVYQGQPIFRDERPRRLPMRRELGDGDSHRIQFCERAPFQVKNMPGNPVRCEVHTDNRYSGGHTDNNCYDENANTARQFCYECNGMCCSNPGRTYMNGCIIPFPPGGNCLMREASNDISSNFSQLSINDTMHRAS